MGATVTMLRRLNTTLAHLTTAAKDLGATATRMQDARDALNAVRIPLRSGADWSGAGQPDAYVVVAANWRSMDTARLRFLDVATHLGAFGVVLHSVARQWKELETILASAVYELADDGTATLYDGANLPAGALTPEQLTTSVQNLLAELDAADTQLVSVLTEAVQDPLPTVGASATPGLWQKAWQAWLAIGDPGPSAAPALDPNYTPIGKGTTGTPDEWSAAVVAGPCPTDGSTYGYGGFIVGPDGKKYPVVVPQYAAGDETLGVGTIAETLGGLDTGWVDVATYNGYGPITGGVGDGTIGAILVAGAAGLGDPYIAKVDGAKTKGLQFDESGRPIQPEADGTPPAEAPPATDPWEFPQIPGADPSKTLVTGLNTAKYGNAVGVVTNVANTASIVDQADANSNYTFQVRFQENADGRVRAIYTAYQVIDGPDGNERVQSYNVAFDKDGEPVLTPTN